MADCRRLPDGSRGGARCIVLIAAGIEAGSVIFIEENGERPVVAATTLKTHKLAWKRNMIRTAILLAHFVNGWAMSEPANSNVAPRRAEVQHMMQHLNDFARELGLNEAATLRIVENVAADMPMRRDDERLIEARTRMAQAVV